MGYEPGYDAEGKIIPTVTASPEEVAEFVRTEQEADRLEKEAAAEERIAKAQERITKARSFKVPLEASQGGRDTSFSSGALSSPGAGWTSSRDCLDPARQKALRDAVTKGTFHYKETR